MTNQTETLATEALGYILSRSAAARQALREALETGGAEVGPIARVETEVRGEKDERLDLVAFDEHGEERVLIEVKFWAGLTDNQPNTYLERLPRDGKPAVLLFVAPRERLETLWAEVLRRADGEFNLAAETETTDAKANGIRSAVVDGSDRRLMLTSWWALLGGMTSRASVDGDSSAERDILQLNALCEREDTAAFLPLHSEEFGLEFPRRMINLQRLVNDATQRGREAGFIDTTGLRVTPQSYGYGGFMRIGTNQRAIAWLGVNYNLWATHRETPLWLMFSESGEMGMKVRRKTGLMVERSDSIPIYLPTGVEYGEVLDAVVRRLQEIADRISYV